MRVFSPSQTKAYLACPYAWLLSREWMPRTFSKMEVYGARGAGVSIGLDEYNRGRSDDEIAEAIIGEVRSEWERNQLDSREWSDMRTTPPTMDDITHQALTLVEAYVNDPPVAFEVAETEYIFRDHGWARADILGRLPRGNIAPIDYKVKDSTSAPWLRQAIINDWKNDWQLMHYCWAVSEEFDIECLEYGICILWYAPNPKIEYVPYTIHPDRMANWIESAQRVWERMEAIKEGRDIPTEVASHKTQFGPCIFQRACLEYNRDPELMEDFYIYKGK